MTDLPERSIKKSYPRRQVRKIKIIANELFFFSYYKNIKIMFKKISEIWQKQHVDKRN